MLGCRHKAGQARAAAGGSSVGGINVPTALSIYAARISHVAAYVLLALVMDLDLKPFSVGVLAEPSVESRPCVLGPEWRESRSPLVLLPPLLPPGWVTYPCYIDLPAMELMITTLPAGREGRQRAGAVGVRPSRRGCACVHMAA